jgi:hypothetical protein
MAWTNLVVGLLIALTLMSNMAMRVVEFSSGGYKIVKIFASRSKYREEIIEF